MKALRTLLAAGMVLATASGAMAVTATLEDILTTDTTGCGVGCFQVGDKQFTNIVFGNSGVSAANIDVIGTVSGSTVFIEWNSNWAVAANGPDLDFGIDFKVTSTQGATIDSIDAQIVGTAGFNDGYITMAESVFNSGSQVGQSNLDTRNLDTIDPKAEANDILTLVGGPFSTVDVAKDIALVAGTETGTSLSRIIQSFHQTSTVPEPGTIVLLGSGLLGLAGFGRRRGKRD